MPLPSQVVALLETWVDPFLKQDLVSAKIVQEVVVEERRLAVRLVFPYPVSTRIEAIQKSIQSLLARQWPEHDSDILIHWKIPHHRIQSSLKRKGLIKNIVAVLSGKGGVGKSTVAVHLAIALSRLGAKVALLDADIYGPSQPQLLGQQEQKAEIREKRLVPIEAHGIQTISIGYLVEKHTPAIWRGPMVSSALQQLLEETAWAPCDYLIMDLPPGTGDIPLTMAQKIPLSGAVVVTTPQTVALLDVEKACHMLQKVSVPLLGIVENMSHYVCEHCQHREALFGSGGGEAIAERLSVPLLAQLPLVPLVREWGDRGLFALDASPAIAKPYWEMAQAVAGALARQPVDYTAKIPEIVVAR